MRFVGRDMIADSNGNGQPKGGGRILSPYHGHNPDVDAIAERNAQLEAEELFDCADEIALKQSRVIDYLKFEKAAKEKSLEAALGVGAMTDKAVDGVLKAKQIGAAIHNSGVVWNDYKAKRFVQRIIALLETSLVDHPDVLDMVTAQLEGVRRTFVTAEASTYTPDQDLAGMDATIPRM